MNELERGGGAGPSSQINKKEGVSSPINKKEGETGQSNPIQERIGLFTPKTGIQKKKGPQNTKFVNANRIEFVDLMEKYVELLERVKNNVSRPIPNVDFNRYLDELNQQRSAVDRYITEKQSIINTYSNSKFKAWIDNLKSKLDNNDYDTIRQNYINKYINEQIQIYFEKLRLVVQAIHRSINNNTYTSNNEFQEKYERYLSNLRELLKKFNLDESYLTEFEENYKIIKSSIQQHYNTVKFHKSTGETSEISRMLESIDVFISDLESINVRNENLSYVNNKKLNSLNNRFMKIPIIIRSIEDEYNNLINFFKSLPVVMQKRFAEQFEAKKNLLINAKEKYDNLYTNLITNLYNKIFTNISNEINRIFENFNNLQNLNNKIDKINELVKQIKELQQKSNVIKTFWDSTNFSNHVNNLNLALINSSFIPFINDKIRALGNSIRANINREKTKLNKNYDDEKRIFMGCLNTFMSQIEGFRTFFNNLRSTIGRANNSIKGRFSNQISSNKALGNFNVLLNTKLRNLKQNVVEMAAVRLNNDVASL